MNRYAAYIPSHFAQADSAEPSSTWFAWDDLDVHVLRRARPDAGHRVLVLHGGGGHAGAIWPLAAAVTHGDAELVVPDLPGYGRTRIPRSRVVA